MWLPMVLLTALAVLVAAVVAAVWSIKRDLDVVSWPKHRDRAERQRRREDRRMWARAGRS